MDIQHFKRVAFLKLQLFLAYLSGNGSLQPEMLPRAAEEHLAGCPYNPNATDIEKAILGNKLLWLNVYFRIKTT